MASRVKGIVVELGGDTTGLDKALKGTNAQIRNTQQQLKDVERLLKLDPTNTQLLEQRQRLLGEAVSQTSDKLDTLKQAERQVQAQFEKGETSREAYESLQREIIATERSLDKLEDGAEDARKAVDGIDEEPLDDVARAADAAGDALDDAGDDASSFGDMLKAGAIVEGVKAIGGAIAELNEETMEYRKIMGSLDISSERAGYTAEQTAKSYRQLYGVLGDDQTAATTVANLQALQVNQGRLNALINGAIGAWATYGDSIPIDGLSEAINETARVGQVTGVFADVLNWGSREGETFGVMLRENTKANEDWNKAVLDAASAEDFFNLALQECSTEAERADLILRAMAQQGLPAAGKAWREQNADIVAANEAQADFTETAAQLAERTAPAVQAVRSGVNELFQAFVELTETIDFDALSSVIASIFSGVSGLVTFLIEHAPIILAVLGSIAGGLAALRLAEFWALLMSVATGVTTLAATFPALSAAIAVLTNPIFLVAAAIVALVVLIATKGEEIKAVIQSVDDWLQKVFLVDWTTIFGSGLGNILNSFMVNLRNIWDAIKQIFRGVIDFIQGVFTADWEQAWSGVVSIFGGLFDGLVSLVKAPINGIIGLLNSAVGAINTLIGGLNRISFRLPDWLGGASFGINIPSIPSIPFLAKGGILNEGSAIVGEAGPELLTVGRGGAAVQPLAGNSSRIESLLGNISGQLGAGSGTPILLTLTLDGQIIGKAAWEYSRGRSRADGI